MILLGEDLQIIVSSASPTMYHSWCARMFGESRNELFIDTGPWARFSPFISLPILISRTSLTQI